jgi:hypothetical protein
MKLVYTVKSYELKNAQNIQRSPKQKKQQIYKFFSQYTPAYNLFPSYLNAWTYISEHLHNVISLLYITYGRLR